MFAWLAGQERVQAKLDRLGQAVRSRTGHDPDAAYTFRPRAKYEWIALG